MIRIEAPILAHNGDQHGIVEISNVVAPGFLVRNAAGHIEMRVPGDLKSDDLDAVEKEALARFYELLGVLRASRRARGELPADVARPPLYDDEGNVTVRPATIRAYISVPGDLQRFASNAARGMAQSSDLRDALRLLGNPNRDATTYYNIHEFAEKEFGGPDGIKAKLGISKRRQNEFTKSASHLGPTEGGRHAKRADPSKATMAMNDLSEYAWELIGAWINIYANNADGLPVVQIP